MNYEQTPSPPGISMPSVSGFWYLGQGETHVNAHRLLRPHCSRIVQNTSGGDDVRGPQRMKCSDFGDHLTSFAFFNLTAADSQSCSGSRDHS